VDILINNAGLVSGHYLHELEAKSIEKTFAVNVFGVFWVTKAFLPKMMEFNSGHIVTISSASAVYGVPRLVDYSASKSAAFGFMDALRPELHRLGNSGVKTTVVCPNVIATGMFEGMKPLNRLLFPILTPEHVAKTVVDAVLTNQEEVYLPPFIQLTFLMRIAPPFLRDWVDRIFFGLGGVMDEFKGGARRIQK
jgi:short-subunit dehydrogenase